MTAAALAGLIVVATIGAGALALARDDETRVSSGGPTATTDVPVQGGTSVPDLVGWTVGRARPAMRDAGLVLSVSPSDPAVDGALILASEPGAGSDVSRGAVVGVRTALPDPPVEVECPAAHHPRGASAADALPEVNSISRLAAEDTRLTLQIELQQQALDRGGPDPTGAEVYMGLWDRWAYSGGGTSVSVAPAQGFQVIVVLGDASACPSAPEFRGVPVTYVISPINEWAGRNGAADEWQTVQGVADGVTPVVVKGEVIWIVRAGDEVKAFADDAQHLPDAGLMWCPSEKMFAGTNHGELFDAEGQPLAGPASAHLDRYGAAIAGDTVSVNLSGRIPGQPNDSSGSIPSEFRDVVGAPWDSGPGSFCDGAVRPPKPGP
ncbi:MAG: PASTA domain-containing protein [Microthrixaceae bacterium]